MPDGQQRPPKAVEGGRSAEMAHLLGLADERLLEGVRTLDHAVRVGVGALELAPPVDVHAVVELLRERAHLCALVQQVASQREGLILERVEVGDRRAQRKEFRAQELNRR